MTVGRCPFTVKPGFDPRSVHMRFLVGKETLGQISSPSTKVFPCQYHFRQFSLLISHTRRFYQKDKQAKSGNLPKSNALFGNHGAFDRMVLSLIGI